jgi:hypothetical protein
MAYSRELLTYWLAASEDGAELLALYEDMRQSFGAISMLTTQVGRDLTMDVLDDLYETLEP